MLFPATDGTLLICQVPLFRLRTKGMPTSAVEATLPAAHKVPEPSIVIAVRPAPLFGDTRVGSEGDVHFPFIYCAMKQLHVWSPTFAVIPAIQSSPGLGVTAAETHVATVPNSGMPTFVQDVPSQCRQSMPP